MCLTDKIVLQTHVTFFEYLVFHEFRRNLYITLPKYLEQEGIADLLFFSLFIHSLLIAHSQHRFPAACVVTNVMTCKYGHHTIDRLEEREAWTEKALDDLP